MPGACNFIHDSVFTNVALNIKAAFAMKPLSVYKNVKICFQQYRMPLGCNPLPSIFANTLPQDVFICVLLKCC